MSIKNFFKINIKNPSCIANLSEDDLKQLVQSLEIEVSDEKFGGFVLCTAGTQVKFNFDSSGNFSGVTARLNSKNITLIHGVGSNELSVFKGAPSNVNPGDGWTIEVDLTRRFLNQPANENNWEIFYASRSAVINNI